MLQNIDSHPVGVIVIETLPNRASAPLGPALDRDATLAEFLAQLTGSDADQRDAASEPAPAACSGPLSRRMAPGRHHSRLQAARWGAARRSADLSALAAELESTLRQIRRRIAHARRLAR
ncbi:MAG: hypothetical protein WD845_14440 [Pirellulales bacterium]